MGGGALSGARYQSEVTLGGRKNSKATAAENCCALIETVTLIKTPDGWDAPSSSHDDDDDDEVE